MTRREKNLAKLVAPLLGLWVLYKVISFALIGPVVRAGNELQDLKDDHARQVQKIHRAERDLKRYKTLYEMTPAPDADEQAALETDEERTAEYFRNKIDELEAASGFNIVGFKGPDINKGRGRGKRKELDTVAFTLDGNGDLRSVMQFLLETYQLDDLLYVTSVDIDPDRNQHSERVTATIKMETVVIPKDDELLELAAGVAGQPPKDAPTGKDGSVPEEGPVGRLAEPLPDYEVLLAWKPDPPKPEPAPVRGACCVDDDCSVMTEQDCAQASGTFKGKDSRCRPNTCKDDDAAPTPTPTPKDDSDRANTIVRGFVGRELLVIKNAGGSTGRARSRSGSSSGGEERQFYRVGQDFDGGTLTLLHRLGVVVSKKNEEQDGLEDLWVYHYDAPLSESRRLAELIEQHGVYRKLLRAVQGDRPLNQSVDPTAQAADPRSAAEAEALEQSVDPAEGEPAPVEPEEETQPDDEQESSDGSDSK